MADWPTISALATAGGTLVLALATFASVRSANRSARTAERALQVGIRPVLFPSRLSDPTEKIMWADQHWARVDGGRATAEVGDRVIYLAMSLRNVGSGIAVLDGWFPSTEWRNASLEHEDPSHFRHLTRDLYVPAGDMGLWQGAIRDPSDEVFNALATVIQERRLFTVELLYGDHEGGQRTITRFAIAPAGDATWLCSVSKHWNLDRADPR